MTAILTGESRMLIGGSSTRPAWAGADRAAQMDSTST